MYGRSDPPVAKRHTPCFSSFETRFNGPVDLQYFAVFCSPTAFFEHLYTSEQQPFKPFEFHAHKAVSWPDGAMDKRPSRGSER
jgi:hypothetical protein